MGISRRNVSGALDPTAHDALTDVYSEESETDRKTFALIKAIKILIDLAGYDLIARIELRDRQTGRIYR